jgi:hypothetical protein
MAISEPLGTVAPALSSSFDVTTRVVSCAAASHVISPAEAAITNQYVSFFAFTSRDPSIETSVA